MQIIWIIIGIFALLGLFANSTTTTSNFFYGGGNEDDNYHCDNDNNFWDNECE